MSKPDHHSEYKRLSVSTKYNLYCIRFGKKENDFKNESIILPYSVHESNPIWVLKHDMGTCIPPVQYFVEQKVQ